MTKYQRIRLIVAAAINVIVFVLAVYCLTLFIGYIVNGSKDIRFRYFTNISILTLGAISLVNSVFLLLSVIKGKS
ncbi:MAG: hypothetical protein J5666_00440 [Bacilli bacterium]|nr:hypothetical protein [Bacilli bacterium]